MWALKTVFAAIIILVVALGASLVMVVLTFAAWKLNITFYQSALIFAGLVAVLVFGGFLYRRLTQVNESQKFRK
jgi:hypothetical protein